MNPLDDNVGILIAFGVTALVILVMAYRTRATRYPVITGTIAGVLCAMVVYAIIELVALTVGGTSGYQLATWLVIAAFGLIPAAVLGLLEGLAASVIFRLLR